MINSTIFFLELWVISFQQNEQHVGYPHNGIWKLQSGTRVTQSS